MNINIKRKDELKVILKLPDDGRELIDFFLENEYENVYLVDQEGNYNGYITNKELKKMILEEVIVLNDSIFHEENDEFFNVQQWFEDHPGIVRLPIVRNFKLIGEYYDTDKNGQCMELRVNKDAIKWIHLLREEIGKLFQAKKWNKVACICSDEEFDTLNEVIGNCCILTKCTDTSKSDLILDLKYTKTYRKVVLGNKNNVHTLDDILSSILIMIVHKYCHTIGAAVTFISGPQKQKLVYVNSEEKAALEHSQNIRNVLANIEYIAKVYSDNPRCLSYVTDKREGVENACKIISNGIHKILLDQSNNYMNIFDGCRYTVGSPEAYNKQIHLYGPCIVQGLCVTDEYTIGSFLQSKVKDAVEESVRVVNHGVGDGGDLINDLLYILNTTLQSKDVVIVINELSALNIEILQREDMKLLYTDSIFEQQHYWFINHPFHCNDKANERIADFIMGNLQEEISQFNFLIHQNKQNYFELAQLEVKENNFTLLENDNLLKYIQELELHRIDDYQNKRIASIVINANPMTLGHQYLVEECAKDVDYLYIFVVEENARAYPFLDRFHMVKEACKEFDNVKVLSGGKIMASVLSFPAYFRRDNEDNNSIDPSMHIKIFAELVCPVLGINVRFFGEEPLDPITNQLNIKAKEVLPEYGIEVNIIGRLKANGNIVSARTVRNLIVNDKFEEILNYVPKSTYERLRKIHDLKD